MSENSTETSSSQQDAASARRNNGTFKWTEERDRLLLREVVVLEPYKFKPGTKEAGLKWSECAEKINRYSTFSSNCRDQRSVRERFNKLVSEYKNKTREEVAASGTSPEPQTETETLLEDIIERMSLPYTQTTTAKDSNKDEQNRKDALKIRNKAMKTWGKNTESDVKVLEGDNNGKTPAKRRKRGGSDALQYLSVKTEKETELKLQETELRKQELELRREELRLQAEHQKEQLKLQQEQMKFMADVLAKLAK